MTTQDIYSWVQMGLQVLIGGGLVAGIYRYFGVLKRAIESQEKTIAAQAEQMKAQSTVLQDFERHSKIMQQVIDFFDPQAQLQREQAYKELFERDMKVWEEAISTAYGVMTRAMRYGNDLPESGPDPLNYLFLRIQTTASQRTRCIQRPPITNHK